jgi:hypothetical protein
LNNQLKFFNKKLVRHREKIQSEKYTNKDNAPLQLFFSFLSF